MAGRSFAYQRALIHFFAHSVLLNKAKKVSIWLDQWIHFFVGCLEKKYIYVLYLDNEMFRSFGLTELVQMYTYDWTWPQLACVHACIRAITLHTACLWLS